MTTYSVPLVVDPITYTYRKHHGIGSIIIVDDPSCRFVASLCLVLRPKPISRDHIGLGSYTTDLPFLTSLASTFPLLQKGRTVVGERALRGPCCFSALCPVVPSHSISRHPCSLSQDQDAGRVVAVVRIIFTQPDPGSAIISGLPVDHGFRTQNKNPL